MLLVIAKHDIRHVKNKKAQLVSSRALLTVRDIGLTNRLTSSLNAGAKLV